MRSSGATQIAFMLPTAYPCSYENFNYASVTVGVAVLVVCLAWYFPRYGARHAFRGGVRQVDYIRSGRVSALCRPSLWSSAPLPRELDLSGHNRMMLITDHCRNVGHSGYLVAGDQKVSFYYDTEKYPFLIDNVLVMSIHKFRVQCRCHAVRTPQGGGESPSLPAPPWTRAKP